MANFDREFFGLVFPGFKATQKIHAQNSRPELSAFLSNFTFLNPKLIHGDFLLTGKTKKSHDTFCPPLAVSQLCRPISGGMPWPIFRSRKCVASHFWTNKSARLLGRGSRGSRQITYLRICPTIWTGFETANRSSINDFEAANRPNINK